MAYYLPINSTSLAHYFVCACIKPARYFYNKPKDIQDLFRNVLLLSTELGTKETDCCIELILTEDEEKTLSSCGKCFSLFASPLPISRVKKVYFQEQRQLEQTLSNINISAAFVPYSLAEVKGFSNVVCDASNGNDKQGTNDYSDQIEMFDRILGALALMKTAREPYMNYSENYASTLSFFNSTVKDNLERQNRKIVDKFFGLFERTGSFEKFMPYLEKPISKEDLDQIATDDKQEIKRSISKAIDFDKLSGMTYAFAILKSYGVGGEAATKKIDSLVSTNFKDLKDGMAEGIALYYGYNRGYSVFSNSYGTEETERQTVKYLLDSQLDYYTIESVYQFVFNKNTTSSRFPYIDEWCPKKNQHPKKKTDYMVLDTVFIGKKKPSVFSEEYFLGFLGEIKTFDFINVPLASLVEHIWNKVAEDTREEIEDAAETKVAETEAKWTANYNKAQAEIDSLKRQIEFQDGSILDLQKQNDTLTKELDLLKSNIGSPYAKVEEKAQLLHEPGAIYGPESKVQEGNDLPDEDQPLAAATSTVDGYPAGKKSGKTIKTKSSSSKTKGASKSTKKMTGKDIVEDVDKDVAENQSSMIENIAKSSTDKGECFSLFDQNE